LEIDVGDKHHCPKILMETSRLWVLMMRLLQQAFISSFRTAGCFLGSFILRKMSRSLSSAFSVADDADSDGRFVYIP
jgi:hypothetical protein